MAVFFLQNLEIRVGTVSAQCNRQQALFLHQIHWLALNVPLYTGNFFWDGCAVPLNAVLTACSEVCSCPVWHSVEQILRT